MLCAPFHFQDSGEEPAEAGFLRFFLRTQRKKKTNLRRSNWRTHQWCVLSRCPSSPGHPHPALALICNRCRPRRRRRLVRRHRSVSSARVASMVPQPILYRVEDPPSLSGPRRPSSSSQPASQRGSPPPMIPRFRRGTDVQAAGCVASPSSSTICPSSSSTLSLKVCCCWWFRPKQSRAEGVLLPQGGPGERQGCRMETAPARSHPCTGAASQDDSANSSNEKILDRVAIDFLCYHVWERRVGRQGYSRRVSQSSGLTGRPAVACFPWSQTQNF